MRSGAANLSSAGTMSPTAGSGVSDMLDSIGETGQPSPMGRVPARCRSGIPLANGGIERTSLASPGSSRLIVQRADRSANGIAPQRRG